jgi:hypothetical protein
VERVDEQPHVAPTACMAPPRADGGRSHVRMSEPGDAPHGKKLYYLRASEPWRYVDAERRPLPVGFAIVKESFAAVPTDHAEPAPRDDGKPGTTPPPITTMVDADGKRWKVGQRADLFVMVKVGEKPGSDDGWIYGTVAPDGTVTSAGRVASCMGCHDEAGTREKLFGLRAEPKQ